MLPTVARPPWRLGELDQNDGGLDSDAWVRKLFSVYAPFTAMFNITGQPAISLPLAWSAGGLPIGVQLIAPPDGEGGLLAAAEILSPWGDEPRRPAVPRR